MVRLGTGCPQLGQVLGRAHEAIPVGLDVFGRAADLGDHNRHVLGGHHFNGVPRADRQLVRIGLLLRNVDAHFAAHAAFEVDLAPLLCALEDAAVDRAQLDAIHRADFEARFAAGAVVGIDDRQLLGNLFAWSFFGHV